MLARFALLAALTLAVLPSRAHALPDIVVIMMDDMDAQMVQYMANVQNLVAREGVTLRKTYFNDPLCCPSRAAMLTGRYVQNNKTNRNDHALFYNAGMDTKTIAVQLDAAGYRTALAGKYLNGYPSPLTPSYTPPGWDVWRANVGATTTFYNYTLTDGRGGTQTFGTGEQNYHDDVLGRIAVDFIRSTPQGTPLFLWLSFHAPHTPSSVAPRFSTTFPGPTAPRVPSFNEADVSDKPAFIRNKSRFSQDIINQIDTRYRNMAKSIQAANEWVGSIVGALAAAGRLEDSYIFFLADNGWMSGQHRLDMGKGLPYEESLRMALHVRGPGVPHDVALDHLISNVNLAPTIAQLAGVAPPSGHNGRSFASVMSANPPAISAWRKSIPTFFLKGSGGSWPGWKGVRTNRYTYTEWTTGERELYDNASDQYQLQSLHANAATVTLRSKLASLTSRLAACTGQTCKTIENEGKRQLSPTLRAS